MYAFSQLYNNKSDDFFLINPNYLAGFIKPAGTEVLDTTTAPENTTSCSDTESAHFAECDQYTFNYFKNSNLIFNMVD